MTWKTLSSTAALAAAGVAALLLGPSAGAAAAGSLAVDAEESWFVAVTDRAGLLGFMGHRHAVLATEWTAELAYDREDPSASSIEVTVPTAALVIDTDAALALAGLEGGPDAETVEELQGKMLGPENLAAEAHPRISFASTAVERTGRGRLRVTGDLTIRGVTERVRVPVRVESAGGGAVRFSGSLTVKQTAFGIEPESVAGVVKVADPVEIRFEVVARP